MQRRSGDRATSWVRCLTCRRFAKAVIFTPAPCTGEMMDFTPQMIPDAFLVEIHLANITDALTVHYDGIFGIGAFDADIVSDQQGAIDLTVTFVRGKPGDRPSQDVCKIETA